MTITILQLQCSLLVMILIGTLGKKAGIITEGVSAGLSKMMINLILPCSVFSAFFERIPDDILKSSVLMILITIAVHLLYILAGVLLYRKKPALQQPVLRFAILCPNSNFMGMPVIGGIYGAEGIFLLSVALLPARIFILSIGIAYFVAGKSSGRMKRLLKSPPLWAVDLGLLVVWLKITLPVPLENAIASLGNCTTPLSMILIGCVISDLKLKMFLNKEIWKLCFWRLLEMPLVVLAMLKLVGITQAAVAGVSVVLSALPAGAMTVMFTKEYEKDGLLAAACVISSTLLSVLTIPLVYLLCARII